MSELIPYFAYGHLCHPAVLEAVVGSRPSMQHAKISGYRLGIQRLEHVPSSVRFALLRRWPLNYRTYALVRAPGFMVHGTVWFLSPEERARIERWQLVPEGWHHKTTAAVVLKTGERIEAHTEVQIEIPNVYEYIDDTDFVPLLNDLALTVENARRLLPPR